MADMIRYYTYLYSDNTERVGSGSFAGDISMETVNRLVKNFFDVKILPSGSSVFVDKEGQEVSLYFKIDADKTEKGVVAMENLKKEQEAKRLIEQEKLERETQVLYDTIESALRSLTIEEIVQRIKGNS